MPFQPKLAGNAVKPRPTLTSEMPCQRHIRLKSGGIDVSGFVIPTD
jgi:hypothetical protein